MTRAPLPDDPVLRGAAVLAGVAAVLALTTVRLLPGWLAVLDASALTGCSLLARWAARDPRARLWRLVAWVTVALCTLWAVIAGPVAGDPPVVLGALVAGFVAATAADQDGSRRSMLVNLALAWAVLTLAAGVAPSSQLALPLALGWGSGLVVLSRCQVAGECAEADAIMRVSRPRPSTRLIATTLVASVAVSAGLFALVRQAQPGLQSPMTSPFGGGPGNAGNRPSRTVQSYLGQSMDLRARGRLSPEPILDVPADSPRLWRSGWLDRYTGSGWEATDQTDKQLSVPVPPGERLQVPADPGDPVAPAVSMAAPPHRYVVHLATPSNRPQPVILPGVLLAIDLLPGQQVHVRGSGSMTVESPPNGTGNGYAVVSWLRPVVGDPGSEARLATAHGADPGLERWKQLPAEVPHRVRELGRHLTDPATTRYNAVRRVEDYLRSHARYQLDSPLPSPGQDAVDDFLFRSRVGFCEQFASAEVVLLRAAGIPARLAHGFASDTLSPDGRRVVRGSDAHAWVEVWFPGQGWVSSDPTAGTSAADAGNPVTEWLARVTPGWLARLLGSWPGFALAAAVVAAAVMAGWRRRRPAPPAGPAPVASLPSGLAELMAAFDRFETGLAAAGVPRRPWETLADLAGRMPGERNVAAALTSLERALYAARPPAPAELRAAAEALDATTPRFLAAAREQAAATGTPRAAVPRRAHPR